MLLLFSRTCSVLAKSYRCLRSSNAACRYVRHENIILIIILRYFLRVLYLESYFVIFFKISRSGSSFDHMMLLHCDVVWVDEMRELSWSSFQNYQPESQVLHSQLLSCHLVNVFQSTRFRNEVSRFHTDRISHFELFVFSGHIFFFNFLIIVVSLPYFLLYGFFGSRGHYRLKCVTLLDYCHVHWPRLVKSIYLVATKILGSKLWQ